METATELYSRYVTARTEEEAQQTLDLLFSHWLMGWCREAVERNLGCYGLRDVDRLDLISDVVAEVLLALMVRLQTARTGTAEPVNNLRAYLSSTAQNACFGRIRSRCPRHVQLQNRIRYLLRNDARFAAWTNKAGDPLAGIAAWRGRDAAVPCPELQRTVVPLEQLLETTFTLAEGPLRVTDLVRTLATALGISDSPTAPVEPDSVIAPERGADFRMIEREALRSLWSEVRELPTQQRSAILLNLRDTEGQGVVELLPVTGIASFTEIAQLLDMTEEHLASIWNDLPLEDARIAELLQLSRQQVINLRKSARDRLGRRMRKLEGNTGTGSTSEASRGTDNRSLRVRLGRMAESVFRRKGSQ